MLNKMWSSASLLIIPASEQRSGTFLSTVETVLEKVA